MLLCTGARLLGDHRNLMARHRTDNRLAI